MSEEQEKFDLHDPLSAAKSAPAPMTAQADDPSPVPFTDNSAAQAFPPSEPMRYQDEPNITEVSPAMPTEDSPAVPLADNSSAQAFPSSEPMRYQDEPSITEVSAEPTLSEEDFLFPPYAELKRPKRMLFFKAVLWMMSVLLVSMAIFFVYRMLPRSTSTTEQQQDNERIPYNKTDTSYAEEYSLPDAPEVSADPDGPQISLVEESTEPTETVASQAYQKASVSVVCVTSYKGGSDYVLNKIGDGSGIIISEDGYIATNSHVLGDDTSTGVMITTYDGTQYLGTIIGVDKKTDLAVLKIDAEKLTPAEFSDSARLFVGQQVYAIGSPGGSNFSNSLTSGTVSAVNRILLTNGYVKYIQTDAAINPGNSGGPLINEDGRVVGMNTSKIVSTNYEGMGFSIPSNKVVEIINKLIRYGYVNDRATIGIEGTTCNLYESKLKNVPQGMVITKINGYSPLIGSDVQEQDIITALNGVHIKSAYEFIDELSKYRPGDTVTISIFRAAKSVNQLPQTFDIELQLADDSN